MAFHWNLFVRWCSITLFVFLKHGSPTKKANLLKLCYILLLPQVCWIKLVWAIIMNMIVVIIIVIMIAGSWGGVTIAHVFLYAFIMAGITPGVTQRIRYTVFVCECYVWLYLYNTHPHAHTYTCKIMKYIENIHQTHRWSVKAHRNKIWIPKHTTLSNLSL